MNDTEIPRTLKDIGANGDHTRLGKRFNSREQFMGFVASELKKLNTTTSINTADIKILNDFKGRVYGGGTVLVILIGITTKLAGLW